MPQGDAPRAAAASRARYRRIVRFATGVMLATWWFEVVLPRIGFARVAERGRTARLRRISARFRVLAIDLAYEDFSDVTDFTSNDLPSRRRRGDDHGKA